VDDKYKGLRLLGKIAIIIAWIILISSVIGALLVLFGVRDQIFRWLGFLGLPFGISTFLWLYVLGKFIYVVTDIETNTRGSSTAVSNLIKTVQDQQAASNKNIEQALQQQSSASQSLDGAIQKQSEAIAQLTDTLASNQAAPASPAAPVAADLTEISGIGPKISEVLHAAGIYTYVQLANTSVDDLNKILADAGVTANPSKWPEQANLAAMGLWDQLKAIKEETKE